MSEAPAGYPELLGRLFSARRSGVRLELDRVRTALDQLDHPEERAGLRIHIGGTNGKGSTGAFVESMLQSAGARVGFFSSPHLNRFEERFRIDGQPVDVERILSAGQCVEAIVSKGDPLTFFERVTLMAFEIFAAARVDCAVIEVGIGGRYDATSACHYPVAAVTGVALEHQRYLGADLHHIAARKAGVFGRGQHAVIGAAGEDEAIDVLVAGARRAGVSSLTIVDRDAVQRAAAFELGLGGSYQAANAACALAIIDAVQACGAMEVGLAARKRGLAAAHLPGRFETVAKNPRIIVDGAHNPHAAAALARALDAVDRERLLLVVGVSADKPAAAVLEPLVRHAQVVIATAAQLERAMPAAEVAEAAATYAGLRVECHDRVADAVTMARELTSAADVIVVTGSLFVVGEARELLCGAGRDPVFLSDPV